MSKLTEKAIQNAFMKLLEERPLNKITVKDIVTECGINRNTFYYHFGDIPALLESVIIKETDSIIRNYSTVDTLTDGLAIAIDFAMKNKAAVMHIYKSVSRDIYERFLWNTLDHVIFEYYSSMFGDRKISEKDRDLILNYYKCTCFGIVTKWLEEDMKDDLTESFSILQELDKGHIEALIEKCEKRYKT